MYANVEVKVDVTNVLDQLPAPKVVAMLHDYLAQRSERHHVPMPFGDGDMTIARRIEEAYLAARRLPDCPREIRDLFWHVFGRAL